MRGTININLKALKNNYLTIKDSTSKEIIAVLKSNAYGHGLLECAKALEEVGCKNYVVATLKEGIELRSHYIQGTIIVLEQTSSYFDLNRYNLSLAITSLNQLKKVVQYKRRLKLHLKLETGLNRLGLKENELDEASLLIDSSIHLVEGVYTHIANEVRYESQIKLFTLLLNKLSKYQIRMIHVNSSSYINKNNPFPYVRIGLSLFGYSKIFNLEKVLSLLCPIYRIVSVSKGELVGYHEQEVIAFDGYLLTIPLGYADGWNKIIRTFGYSNTYISQVGETCMDHMMFFSKEKIEGDYIEIIGTNVPLSMQIRNNELSPYEVLSSLSPRIEKNYIK